MVRLFLILFLFLFKSNSAQITFQKAYGGTKSEINECVNNSRGILASTSDSGFAICHTTYSYGNLNSGLYFIKLNKFGDTIFTKTFFGTGSSSLIGRSVFQNQDGGFILGLTSNGPNAAMGLIRTNYLGDTLWYRSFSTFPGSGSTGYFGMRLKDNNFISTGGLVWGSDYHSAMAKVDLSGNLLFGKRYNPGNNNSLNLGSTTESYNGDIISVGYFTDFNFPDFAIMKTDKMGNVKWAKSYGTVGYSEYAQKAVELSDKSIAVVGFRLPPSAVGHEIILLRVDSLGNQIFSEVIGDGWCNTIISDSSDDLYFAGVTTYTNSIPQVVAGAVAVKTSSLGSLKWMKRYDNGEYASGICLTPDKGIAIAGMTTKFGAGLYDVFLFKADSTGDAGCNSFNYSFPLSLTPFITNTLSITTTSDIVGYPGSANVTAGTIITNKCQNFATGIEETELQNDFSVYPNPASSILFIKSDTDFGKCNIIIYDVFGKIVLESNYDNLSSVSININQINSGVYFLNIKTENAQAVKKFVKQ